MHVVKSMCGAVSHFRDRVLSSCGELRNLRRICNREELRPLYLSRKLCVRGGFKTFLRRRAKLGSLLQKLFKFRNRGIVVKLRGILNKQDRRLGLGGFCRIVRLR
jgi:hypothetical protein